MDLVIPEENWDQKISDVKEYHVDTFVMGDDWKGKFDFLKITVKSYIFQEQKEFLQQRSNRILD